MGLQNSALDKQTFYNESPWLNEVLALIADDYPAQAVGMKDLACTVFALGLEQAVAEEWRGTLRMPHGRGWAIMNSAT